MTHGSQRVRRKPPLVVDPFVLAAIVKDESSLRETQGVSNERAHKAAAYVMAVLEDTWRDTLDGQVSASTVVRMVTLESRTYHEAAETLGVSHDAVRQAMARARRKLAPHWAIVAGILSGEDPPGQLELPFTA